LQFEEVDISQGLSPVQIEQLIGTRDYKLFLNPRNELYREKKMKDHPPPRAEAIQLMSKNPNLIRRPILLRDGDLIPGFDEEQYGKLAGLC
jgi:arsenate reductase-like glutaredoxin family protein